jgi:hypothetical protein
MAALEKVAPMSQIYFDKLEHIRGAVAHHVYEEGNWFIDLTKKAEAADQVNSPLAIKKNSIETWTEDMGMKQTAGGSSSERQATRWPLSFEEHC